MSSTSSWAVFVPTFFVVSLTPGLCMTLALTLGMQIGVRRSLHMMWGELIGVGLVALFAGAGLAAFMLRAPLVFDLLKWGGGAYLAWVAVNLWRSRGSLALGGEGDGTSPPATALELATKGFVTAVSNPKGWAFFIALLPPFLDADRPLGPQLAVLVGAILAIEWTCLMIYASGGRALRRLLLREGNVRLLNRLAGAMILGVAIWLVAG